ncbi:MAG TPA: group 1 truncated hemoglobin, partial [Microbacteriaceae bacterium]|nr:group 1 truncated hemoglobin [Microbacteriaceae bacterium]
MTGSYDEVGGHAGMKAAVRVLYDRVTADSLLGHYFEGIDMERLASHQHAFLAAALGGPDLFSGRDLHTAHAGLDITDEAFDAL